MQELTCGVCLDLNERKEKLYKFKKALGKLVKDAVRFFAILSWYILFNAVYSLVCYHQKSVSTEFMRILSDGLRQIVLQDAFVYISFIYESRINRLFFAVIAFIFSSFILYLYRSLIDLSASTFVAAREKKISARNAFFNVVNYKQHVAFLA